MAFLLNCPSLTLAAWVVGPDGTLERESGGKILGKGSGSGGDEDLSGSNLPGSAGKEETRTEVRSGGGVLKAETKDSGETRTETRLPGGIRFETRTEEGKSRAELRLGGTRIRLENEDGRFKLKIKNDLDEDVSEVEPEGENLLEVAEREEDNRLKISTISASRLLLSRRRLGAITDLPISVSLQTNQLIVSTQAGSRVVAILPDQAIENMLREKLLDKVGGFSVSEILSEASPSSTFAESVELKVDAGGEPVYEIFGSKLFKVLGFWPVSLPRKITISAQTGAVEKVSESLLNRFLNLISTRELLETRLPVITFGYEGSFSDRLSKCLRRGRENRRIFARNLPRGRRLYFLLRFLKVLADESDS